MGKEKKIETLDMFSPQVTISTMRQDVRKKAQQKGCLCPVCDQFVKIYKRSITSTMARQLIHAYRCHGEGNFFHTRDMVMAGAGAGDFSKLQYWKLIESKIPMEPDDDKKSSGLWRITPLGKAFILAETDMDQFAIVYKNEVLEFQGGKIGIAAALGNQFSYAALMQSTPLSSGYSDQQQAGA